MSVFSKEMGPKLSGVVGYFPGFGMVITYVFNISEGKEAVDITLE